MHPRLKSFVYAYEGLKFMLKGEPNFRIHLLVAVAVVILGFVFQINGYEWIAVVFSIGLVIVTEAVNTAIENVCDKIQPNKDKDIKIIKDIGAAAVLISAIMAVVVGLIVFAPKIFT